MANSSNNKCILWAALLVLPLFFALDLNAQNLVVNPSFEQYLICPDDEGQFVGYVDDWITYFSTPDYLNLCDYTPNWILVDALHGVGMINSTFSYHDTHLREYLHGQLKNELKVGGLYYVEYHIYQPNYGIATDEYHAHLTDQVIDDDPADGVLRLTPHIQYDGGIIMPDSGWTSIHGCYRAQGGEDKIILGNFFDDSATNSITIIPNLENDILVDQVGVYLIDDLRDRSDTILSQGDTLDFPITDPRRYRQDGLGCVHQFIADEPGCYKLYYSLPSCDFLDSFNICVLGCPKSLDVDPFGHGDDQFCVMLDQPIQLDIPDSLHLFINGLRISDLDRWQPNRGNNLIEIKHPRCDLVEAFTLVYAQCCNEATTDSISCPVDTTSCPVDTTSCHLYVPNAFSPNNDGINDRLFVYTNCELTQYTLRIYNRYGAKVFESRDQAIGWDGTFRAQRLSSGVYVFTLTYHDGHTNQFLSGDIQLMR